MYQLISRLPRKLNLKLLQTCNHRTHYYKPSIPVSAYQSDSKPRLFVKPTFLSTLPFMVDPPTIEATTESTIPTIIAANESMLYAVHNAGLPWWATIVAGTIVLRTTLTLPIAIYQQRSLGKMLNLAPMVQSWAETLKVQIMKESKQFNWTYKKYQGELQKQYKQKVKSIYRHHGCARWKVLLLPWIQIPLFISMSLTLRHITAYPLPWFGKTAELPAVGLVEGGLAWFVDLTAVDPTAIIPVLIGAGNLLNVELNAMYARDDPSKTQKIMTNTFRILSVAFIPIAANAPMAICVYWFSSAWYSVLQNIAFKVPRVRSLLKMPLLPKKVDKKLKNKTVEK